MKTITEMAQEAGMSINSNWAEQKLEAFAKLVREEALAEPGQERNFCTRCGKRTQDIHTCTPPQESKHD